MKRLGLSVALVLLLCVGLPASSDPPKAKGVKFINAAANTAKVLTGIKTLGVTIADFPKDLEDQNLDQSQVRTDIELMLRQNGIRIIPNNRGHIAPDAVLDLGLNTIRVKSLEGVTAYNINLSLRHDAMLLGGPVVVTVSDTTIWEVESVGMVGDQRHDYMRDAIKGQINRFLNDWLAANPK